MLDVFDIPPVNLGRFLCQTVSSMRPSVLRRCSEARDAVWVVLIESRSGHAHFFTSLLVSLRPWLLWPPFEGFSKAKRKAFVCECFFLGMSQIGRFSFGLPSKLTKRELKRRQTNLKERATTHFGDFKRSTQAKL